jgi:hypothetical protein
LSSSALLGDDSPTSEPSYKYLRFLFHVYDWSDSKKKKEKEGKERKKEKEGKGKKKYIQKIKFTPSSGMSVQ